MNTISQIIAKERAPFERNVAEAQAAYEKQLAASAAEVGKAEAKLKQARADLVNFQQALVAESSGTTGSAKKPAVKSAKAPKGIKTTKTATKRAIQGRGEVKSNERPPLVPAIRMIMGKKVWRTRDVTAELKVRGWAPQSTSLDSYVPQVMAGAAKQRDGGPKPVFEAVKVKGRGHYRVRADAPPIHPNVKKFWGHVAASEPIETVTPETKAVAKTPAKKAPVAKVGGKKGKGQQKCSVEGCGVLGHNKKGHEKWAAGLATVVAGDAAPAPVTLSNKVTSAKMVSAAAKPGKGQRKCSVPGCGVLGHNKNGHEKWVAAQARPSVEKFSKSTEASATKQPSSEKTAKPRFQTADEIMAEVDQQASSDKPAQATPKDLDMAEAGAAFGTTSAG